MTEKQDKSVLDHVPVEDKAFPLRSEQPPPNLEIVGHCPSCGAPIYGHKKVKDGTEPKSVRSCNCWTRQGIVEQKMEHRTK